MAFLSYTPYKKSSRKYFMNLPNKITVSRFILSMILFIILYFIPKNSTEQLYKYTLDIALVLFIIAGSTDLIDGHLARKYNLVTAFGRIADPFADKVLVCGSFIYFISLTNFVLPWMVIIIIARELLVSNLRSYIESLGYKFGASISGKLKMFFQSLTAVLIFLYLAHGQNIHTIIDIAMNVMVYLTVFFTALSGITYIIDAAKILSQSNQKENII